ncbi:MAG: hypothetical protein NVSMB9_35710 [Isosphaeraceae bacterium]
MFLVLLRVAIGWHFHHEGWEKVEATRKGGTSWTAEPFLRAASGPLGRYFRGLVPDVNGLARLDPDRLKKSLREDVDRIVQHFGFDTEQTKRAMVERNHSEEFADIWFHDPEKSEKRRKYLHDLATVQTVERSRDSLAFEKERAAARRKELDVDRLDLTKELDARASALREAVIKLATPAQLMTAGPYSPPRTTLDWINLTTTYSVWLMGLCLILGFLTRPAAFFAAIFLLQIYLSMPPWPGLPPNPRAEGHYYVVDKNLVEMFACLALACLPTGRWVGIDALLFGRSSRARRAREDENTYSEAPRNVRDAGRRASSHS